VDGLVGTRVSDAIEAWGGDDVAIRFDDATGALFVVAIHSTALGPAMGGTRLQVYPSNDDAVIDALRLSQAMTMKHAAAGLPYGGGKAVVSVPVIPAAGSSERGALLRAYGSFVDELDGRYVTAADMNTDQHDMDLVGERTRHVLGRSRDNGGSGDPAPGTATGVFHALRATCQRVFGSPDLTGRSVLVQGTGAVGEPLAAHLTDAGARTFVADVDPARAEATARRVGADVVGADDVIGTPIDVFAPCAKGGVLNAGTIPRLRCRAVAGAANNQLATPEDADRLEAAGITYAPDYVANAGGVLWLAGYETLGWDDARMQARLEAIGDTIDDVFAAADAAHITSAAAADRLALSRLK